MDGQIDLDNVQLILSELFVRNVYSRKDELISAVVNDSEVVDCIMN